MKRSEHFKFVNNAKKPKLQLQENAEENIWGDDPEIDEIDRCIDLATQICSQSTHTDVINNTLATYDEFKPNQNMFTSTQAFLQPPVASTSKNVNKQINHSTVSLNSVNTVINKDSHSQDHLQLLQKLKSLELQNKKLTEIYETKDGEIAILRSQLKQVQKSVDSEKMQKLRILEENQQKWNAKLNASSKEVTTLKCEIDLKNLEIANLKEKVNEVKKVYSSNLNMSIINDEMNASQVDFLKRKIPVNDKVCRTSVRSVQTESSNSLDVRIRNIYCPLQEIIPSSLFIKCLKENSTVKLRSYSDSAVCAFRHNFSMIHCENIINVKPVANNSIELSVQCLYTDVLKIMKCTEEELNSDRIYTTTRNIISLTKEILGYLLSKLQKINQSVSYDDIEDMNNLYLEQESLYQSNYSIFSETLWCENESGVDARRCIGIIAALSNYSDIVFKYLTGQLTEKDMITDSNNVDDSKLNFLETINQTLIIIKRIRKSEQFSGYLASVTKLLCSLCQKGVLTTECYHKMCEIFRQIIFARPNRPVLKYICELLKCVSRHYTFLSRLCTKSKSDVSQPTIKEGLKFFTESSCIFRILATELETCKMDVDMSCDVMQFLKNTISSNVSWMYQQEEQRCDCLICVYSLAIDIMYNSLDEFLTKNMNIESTTVVQTYHTTFRVGLLFLDILTLRIPDLVVRCSKLYSKYQTIIQYLNSIQNRLNLDTAHETALQNLLSQVHCHDVRTKNETTCTKNNIESIFNNCFETF